MAGVLRKKEEISFSIEDEQLAVYNILFLRQKIEDFNFPG